MFDTPRRKSWPPASEQAVPGPLAAFRTVAQRRSASQRHSCYSGAHALVLRRCLPYLPNPPLLACRRRQPTPLVVQTSVRHCLAHHLYVSRGSPRRSRSRASNSSRQPARRTISATTSSTSPSRKASRESSASKSKPPPPPKPGMLNTSLTSPALCRLIKTRLALGGTRSMRPEKGCTTRDVPMTRSRSQRGKSASAHSKKRGGRASPKKTMSGFTSPPCLRLSSAQPDGPASHAALTSSMGTA
mmetsp:Transcript_36742/g.116977  ORF Transcript_36742/g.116977 Transcript_36742/m.116977 type:complete len:244 (+) Transcript_36742:129-860(+)